MPRPRPSFRMPASPFRRRLAVSAFAMTTGIVAASAIVSVGSAAAAGPGQYAVSGTPITLNQPSDNLLGRMTPAADAATKGMYAAQVGWPVIPVHIALAPNGHLLSYGSPVNTAQQGGVAYDDWNPALGTTSDSHTVVPSMASYDSFCNALSFLPDGRAFMVGGNGANATSNQTMYFDPASGTESMGPVLKKQRWYATVLHRPNDTYAVIGGGNYYAYGAYLNPNDNSVVATTPEVGSGTGAWSLLNGATSTALFGAQDNRWWYPRAFNAPNGSVFGISGDRLWTMTTSGGGSIKQVGTLPVSPGVSGSAVMYAPGKILVAGGGEVANDTATSATNAAETIDITGTTPVVRKTGSMAAKRQWLNATVLPTGEVLANGGTVIGTNGGADNSSYTTETWSPSTGTWRTGAAATRIRTYHSTSLLMPSGAVLTGGGGVPGPEDNFNTEMYYPSYLFSKNAAGQTVWANRPTITSLAGSLTWGGSLTIGTNDARQIASVSLISAGTVTHSQNTDQRRIPLTFRRSGSTVTATLPSSVNTMPSGTYELSVVDSAGVPSPAQLVTLKNGAAGTVTVYEEDQSAGQVGPVGTVVPGTASLTPGTSIGLDSVTAPGNRVSATSKGVGVLAVGSTSSTADRMSTGFVVRVGLAGATGVSFESASTAGSFLSVVNGALTLKASDGSASFADAATFNRVQGLQGQNSSFTLASDPKTYLRRLNGAIVAQASDGSDRFRADATFRVRAALGPAFGFVGLTNVNSKLALAQAGGATAVGTNVVQETPSAGLGQDWELRDAGDGQYLIVNPLSGLVLGINGMAKDNGGTALVWNDNGTADHLWTFVPRDGHWLIRNANSGRVLGIDRMQLTDGAQVLQWDDNGTADHDWDLTAQGQAPAVGTYTVTNAFTGLVLDTKGASTAQGAAVVQSAAAGGTSQTWTLKAAGAGQVKIVNNASGLLLGIQNASEAQGATALVWGDTGTDDHLWRIVPQNGRMLIVNVNSELVLGADRMQTAAGTAVLQWADNGTADHLWTFTAK